MISPFSYSRKIPKVGKKTPKLKKIRSTQQLNYKKDRYFREMIIAGINRGRKT